MNVKNFVENVASKCVKVAVAGLAGLALVAAISHIEARPATPPRADVGWNGPVQTTP
jgi:hypothetical protein